MKNLNEEGLVLLNEKELCKISGGFWQFFPPALAIALVVSAINNWGDIRQGFSDGWNGTPSH